MPDELHRDIGELYHRTGHLVLRRCTRMLADPEEAMDVTQWVYVRAMEVGFEVRSPGESLAWLYRTAAQRCLHLLRMRGTRSRLRVVHADSLTALPPTNPEIETSSRELVVQALAAVDERTGEIALATWLGGLSNERAAELFEVSVRTIGRARAEFEDVVRRLGAEEAS